MTNERKLISIKAFCSGHDIEQQFIHELVEYELIEVFEQENELWLPEEQLDALERMKRLRYELDINTPGIGAVMQLLHQLDELQKELNELRKMLAHTRQ